MKNWIKISKKKVDSRSEIQIACRKTLFPTMLNNLLSII